jgi:Protein of unknown function (DUF3761)
MKALIRSMLVVSVLVASQALTAQAPAGAPAGATGLCNDGTYWTGATKSGACRGHKGVKTWYAAATPSPATAPPTTITSAPAPVPPAATPAPATARAMTPAPKASSMTPAPGGGAGQVWLNTATNVYHCQGTKYYGTTKAGAYMTEAAAKAKGAHPEHGKPCS